MTPPFEYVYKNFYLALFFLLSGYFTSLVPTAPIAKTLWGKFKYIFIPTVACGLLYIFTFGFPLDEFLLGLYGRYKGGYWFTWTLFVIFAVVVPLQYCASKATQPWISRYLLPVVFIVSLALSFFWGDILGLIHNGRVLMVLDIIDFGMVFLYLPYFIAGMILRQYRPGSWRWIKNPLVLIAAFGVYICLLRVHSLFSTYQGLLTGYLQGFSGILLMLALGSYLEDRYLPGGLASREMQRLGRYSLIVYLMHFFFIQFAKMAYDRAGMDFLVSLPVLGFIIAVAAAFLIAYICIGVAKALQRVPIIYKIFCGRVIE